VARWISLVVLLVVVVVFAILFFRVMATFMLPLFLSMILVVVFSPLHRWFVRRCRGRERIAAGFTTIAILLIVLLPLLLILGRAATEGWSIVKDVRTDTLLLRTANLREKLGLGLPPEEVRDTLTKIDTLLDRLDAGPVRNLDEEIRELEPHLTATRQWMAEIDGLGPGDDGVTPAGAEARQKFDRLTEQLEELVKIDQSRRRRPKDIRALEDFNFAVAGAQSIQRQLERLIMGDPTLTWLKAKANPSKAEVQSIRAELQEWLAPVALTGGRFLLAFIIGFFVMVIGLFYFLADGRAMLVTAMRLSPLDQQYEEQLLEEFVKISRAVVVATLLSAFAQAILAGIGFFTVSLFVKEFEAVFLLSVLTLFLAMVPFVGATAIWAPTSVWLAVEGYPAAGVCLALYGALIISLADNVIKPLVLHGQSNLHPLLALLSVLGGVKTLGPIGIFVGPMAVVFLQAVLQMLHHELNSLRQPSTTEAGVPVPTPPGALP
jgi:predicted PurR-regulated permease PerM